MHRRSLLTLGAASAAVLALGGGALAMLHPGLHAGKLSMAGREVLAGVSRGLLDGSLPVEPTALSAALQGLLDRVDGVVAALPAHTQSELSRLLALLASAAGRRGLAGLGDPWPQAAVADIQNALQAMRISSVTLRQQAYLALHDLVAGAHFSDAQNWGMLGYPGPAAI